MASSFPLGSMTLMPILLLVTISLAGCSAFEKYHLHFYLQESRTGPNATVARVASLPRENNLIAVFGDVIVFDHFLTEGPDASSKVIGREQGLGAITSLDGNSLLTTLTFIFTEGQYAGSTFTVVGLVSLSSSPSERPVVGGTGLFRLIRGYVVSRSLSAISGNDVFEIDVHLNY